MRLAKSTITAAASTGGVPPWWILEIQVRSASTVVATRGEYTYTIFDGVDGISAAVETVAMLPGVLRVRAL